MNNFQINLEKFSSNAGSNMMIENRNLGKDGFDDIAIYLQDVAKLTLYWHLKRRRRELDAQQDNDTNNPI